MTCVAQKRCCLSSVIYCLRQQIISGGSADRKPLDYYKRTMYYPFLDHLLSELDSRSVKPRPLFTITNLLPKNVGNWSPGRISFKEILGAYNPDIPEELDNYRKVTKVNVCVGKHDGTECTVLWPQLLKRFLTVTHKSSQIYPGLFMTLSTNHHSHYYTERSFSALRRLKNLPEVHDERRSPEWTCS